MEYKRSLVTHTRISFKLTKNTILKKIIVFVFMLQLISSCSDQPKKETKTDTKTSSIKHQIPYILGEQTVFFKTYENSNKKTIYFNMHDDENTAVEAAKSVIDKVGGKLIEIQALGDRNISFNYQGASYKFDPNRIYTSNGVKKTLKDQGNYSNVADSIVTRFAKYIVDSLLVDAKIIVTLHNNTQGNYAIDSYKKGGIYENDASQVYINSEQDLDDFFYVTEANYFQTLKEKGYNTLLQDNSNVTDDGSLSVYCGYKNIGYINVEAQKGHLKEQEKMLYSLQKVLDK